MESEGVADEAVLNQSTINPKIPPLHISFALSRQAALGVDRPNEALIKYELRILKLELYESAWLILSRLLILERLLSEVHAYFSSIFDRKRVN